MRIFSVFILAGAGLGLAGCRSDNGPKTTAEFGGAESQGAASALPDADRRPVVVCFGDSLTAGFGAEDGASYPDFLQKDLDRDGYKYRVVNEGVSGNTTKDGVDRVSEVVALKPAVVVLEFGGNDGLRGVKVETTRRNLGTMIERLKAAGTKVVLAGITLPPDYGQDYVKAFTATFPLLAKKYELPVLPFIYVNVYGLPGMIQADGIHATAKGNEAVARNVLPLVEAQISK